MRISYDEKSHGLLIAFGDPASYRSSREVAPGVVVDFDKDGKPLAVELEDAEAVIDPNEIRRLVHPRITKGADLRAFRERLGLTQERLGDLIEVPRNTIARWEREELPIQKARQLELALSAILRPQIQRRFRIVFSDDEGEGFLECGFCGERYSLPFGMDCHNALSENPTLLIREHHEPDFDDDTNKVSQCPNWHRWQAAAWEVLNTDSGDILSRGEVRVAKNGEIIAKVVYPAA